MTHSDASIAPYPVRIFAHTKEYYNINDIADASGFTSDETADMLREWKVIRKIDSRRHRMCKEYEGKGYDIIVNGHLRFTHAGFEWIMGFM